MKMFTQKDAARVLDRAAERSENPATSKQVWFLAGLWAKSQSEVDYNDFLLSEHALDRFLASDLIDMSLRAAAREAGQ